MAQLIFGWLAALSWLLAGAGATLCIALAYSPQVWVVIEKELRWDLYMPHVVLAHSPQV
jgi:hypothetical protein